MQARSAPPANPRGRRTIPRREPVRARRPSRWRAATRFVALNRRTRATPARRTHAGTSPCTGRRSCCQPADSPHGYAGNQPAPGLCDAVNAEPRAGTRKRCPCSDMCPWFAPGVHRGRQARTSGGPRRSPRTTGTPGLRCAPQPSAGVQTPRRRQGTCIRTSAFDSYLRAMWRVTACHGYARSFSMNCFRTFATFGATMARQYG